MWMTENNLTNIDRPEYGLLEQILIPFTLNWPCKLVVSLSNKYLNAGVVAGEKLEEKNMGVPHGGPLIPLLSSIMLNELVKELKRRRHRSGLLCWQSCNLLQKQKDCRSDAGEHHTVYWKQITPRVNRGKTSAACIRRIRLLGYSFYVIKGIADDYGWWTGNNGNGYELVIVISSSWVSINTRFGSG